MRLIYVMDPMCAWCYGFQPELDTFLDNHPNLEVDWIMGGLAPDNDQPMDEDLKQSIASYWHQIEKQARVSFNHNYWQNNTPYRSTYPACRAVITAESLTPRSSSSMVKAIQTAYYQEAKNPSSAETLIDYAGSIGFDEDRFAETLKSEEIEDRLQQHLTLTYQLQVSGFPALFYINDRNQAYPLTLSYTQVDDLEKQFSQLKANGVL